MTLSGVLRRAFVCVCVCGQVEEVQSLLARKVSEQEALEKRADKAEAERAEAEKALESEKAEVERLNGEVAKHEAELKARSSSSCDLDTTLGDLVIMISPHHLPSADAHRASRSLFVPRAQLAAFMISTRQATEDKLSGQARKVLGCLNTTETEAATLHTKLSQAADADPGAFPGWTIAIKKDRILSSRS